MRVLHRMSQEQHRDAPPRRTIAAWRWIAAAALLGAAAGAAIWSSRELLPREGELSRGLLVGGAPVLAGASAEAVAEAAAQRALEQRVTFTWGGEKLVEASLSELGATVDTRELAVHLASVGHEAGLVARIDAALEARRGHTDFPVHVRFPIEPLAEKLERLKDEHDSPPLSAKLDLAHHTATEHTPGRYLDVYAAAEALDRAVATGAPRGLVAVAVPAFEIAPHASREAVLAVDTSQVVSRFETRFSEGQIGRAGNVRRAAGGMDGVVLMPGETVSFNANVGARSIDNGFALAPEIYKGELRDGIGGGTCQVSGTLHAAAFFGGLDIVERINHSRPSGYIHLGLDATVVFPTVDLKLRNPYDFPVVIHAVVDKGTLAFEILGREKPAKVDYETVTVGTASFKRKIEEDAGVKEGAVVVKQRGIRGVSVRKTRTIHLAMGRERVEVSTDVYPPTFEILKVAPGTDPDSLPPLPGPDDKPTDAAPAAPRTAAN
ncbi:MAG: VanW family protein [Byssovorax sp.]